MKNIVRALLAGFITAAVAALILLFIFAFVANNAKDSMAGVNSYGKTAFFVSVFTGSVVTARLAAKSPMSLSLILCLIYILICFLLLLIFGGSTAGTWITYLGGVAAALAGGFFGSFKKPKKPKSLKTYKKYMRK